MGRRWMRNTNKAAALLLVLTVCVGMASAADKKKRQPRATASYTAMPLDSGYGAMDLTEPSTPPEEIIKKFEAKESVFREALNHYTYRRTVRVQTVDDDNKVDGEYYQVDDVIFAPNGKRTERVVFAPQSSLERISMSPADASPAPGRPFPRNRITRPLLVPGGTAISTAPASVGARTLAPRTAS